MGIVAGAVELCNEVYDYCKPEYLGTVVLDSGKLVVSDTDKLFKPELNSYINVTMYPDTWHIVSWKGENGDIYGLNLLPERYLTECDGFFEKDTGETNKEVVHTNDEDRLFNSREMRDYLIARQFEGKVDPVFETKIELENKRLNLIKFLKTATEEELESYFFCRLNEARTYLLESLPEFVIELIGREKYDRVLAAYIEELSNC